ncbi:metal ABC transporter substrate-binding protein [Halorubrum sp. CSM-61]|uniref:metal ABC transporter substrate-binding protein n=1 Tax=Halorubrum sp. CSM-61 TaxID=2485838 RepID=UPI000F4BAB25|nr:metal ABC transporter substrate-binding protein [Halorubrum sp. CSM-61]
MYTDANSSSNVSRRRFAAIGAGALAGGLAGCTGNAADAGSADDSDDTGDGTGDSDDAEHTVVASFFTFYDFADSLAEGTDVAVENLVPTGLHGHGWEPDPSIQRRITDADALVHVGPDFQPWVDRAIDALAAESTETELINARAGVDLIPLADSLDEEEEAVEGAKDPHFWLDPQRAKGAVENIADGLTAVDQDHEATIRENAAALAEELDALDEEWQAAFDAAERDVAFLAAHNAFAYLAERYDATIEPLVVNLAANDDVRPADMQRAQDAIAEHGIEHIGAAVFEPIRPARQLLEQTDVEAYYPVTPYAGTAESWVERGWGYFDIAREVNLPTFRILLGVDDPEDVTFADHGRNFEP